MLIAEFNDLATGIGFGLTAMSTWRMAQVLNGHDLYVRPAFRRNKVATAIINKFEAIARSKDCSRLSLETNLMNLPARRLYSSLGFKGAGIDKDGKSHFIDTLYDDVKDSEAVLYMSKDLD